MNPGTEFIVFILTIFDNLNKIPMFRYTLPILMLFCAAPKELDAQSDSVKLSRGKLVIHPVQHASMVLYADTKTIYIDPVGGAELYQQYRKPDYILITDIHGDHMDSKTIEAVKTNATVLVAPGAVAEQLNLADTSRTRILSNGQESEYHGIRIKAVPMYNLPEDASSRHVKGRGNGYVLTIGGKRIYISGDTEDIPEMRNLKNIDIAFVCMNLPYTMDIKQAADAVLEFKPRIVYPYHFRGQNGLSDVESFRNMVNKKDPNIEVRLRNWYPSK